MATKRDFNLEPLQSVLRLAEHSLKNDPENPRKMYHNAMCLIDIGIYTKNTEYYYKALNLINMALSIEITRKNLIQRAKIYMLLNDKNNAQKDILLIQTLQKSEDLSQGIYTVTNIYIENIINNIIKHFQFTKEETDLSLNRHLIEEGIVTNTLSKDLELEFLENELKLLDESIQLNPEIAINYLSKTLVFMKIGQHTNNTEYFKKASEFVTSSITLLNK